MGHLLEAIKKLEDKREAVRPQPVRRLQSTEPAAKIWRFDAPHPIAAAHRATAQPDPGSADRALNIQRTAEIQGANATPATPEGVTPPSSVTAPEAPSAAGGGEQRPADVVWRIAPPAVPSDYYNLAARLVAPAGSAPRPQSVLLTGVSKAALDAVSLAALAVVLSAEGSVLWVDTRNIRPTPTAKGPTQGKNLGWHELKAGKVVWKDVIVPTSLAGVSFVGCGDRAIEVDGPKFERELFEPLRPAFSFVLIVGGLVEESAPLASICGVTGLIATVGHTTHGQLDRAVRALGAAGIHSPLVIAVDANSL